MQTKNISDQLSEHATSLVKWMDEKLSKKLNIDIENLVITEHKKIKKGKIFLSKIEIEIGAGLTVTNHWNIFVFYSYEEALGFLKAHYFGIPSKFYQPDWDEIEGKTISTAISDRCLLALSQMQNKLMVDRHLEPKQLTAEEVLKEIELDEKIKSLKEQVKRMKIKK